MGDEPEDFGGATLVSLAFSYGNSVSAAPERWLPSAGPGLPKGAEVAGGESGTP